MKYLVVTGGVVSGLGKGITISSLGVLLRASGVRVTAIKIDPYLNLDAGTMSPLEHGEVYVLDDGAECDLDLGNYERYLDLRLTKDHNVTTGKVYDSVIRRERRGDYLGKTVQVVPHITDCVQDWIERVALLPVDGGEGPADVCLIEVHRVRPLFPSLCVSFPLNVSRFLCVGCLYWFSVAFLYLFRVPCDGLLVCPCTARCVSFAIHL